MNSFIFFFSSRKMAIHSGTSSFLILSVLLIIINSTPSMAVEEFKVGDALGWRRPAVNETELYNVWASRRKFHVGDLLRFVYSNDSVVKVEKWGYYHCNLSSPEETVYTDGNNTVITLDKPGPVYFVSGDHGRCKDGERLYVEVLPLYPATGSHSPPPMAGPPEYFPGISPAAASPLHSNSGSKGATTISSVHGAAAAATILVASFAAFLA